MDRSGVSRRRFLAGAAGVLALPFFESLVGHRHVARADTPAAPRRFMTFHMPIGAQREAWAPSGTETDWTFGATQAGALDPFKNQLCMVTHVDNASDSGHSSHTGKVASLLTGGDVPKTAHTMSDSVDQVIATALAGKTPFRSLELGTSILYENPNAEAGWDPVLKDHLSWNGGTPLPKEIDPVALFDRLFGSGSPLALKDQSRRQKKQSVLDFVSDDAKRLQGRLGKNDNQKLDEYFTGLRELETRINAPSLSCSPGAAPTASLDIRDRVQQMLDISVFAFQCDLTRVITFGYEHTVTEQTHPWVGVTDGYHIGVTHNNPGAEYAAVNKWIVSQFAYLLGKLKATADVSGNLLDNSIVYFTSEMGNGFGHDGTNLPIIVAGGGGGRIQGGRLLDRPGQGNGNLLFALLQAMDVNVSSFGVGFNTPLPGLVSL